MDLPNFLLCLLVGLLIGGITAEITKGHGAGWVTCLVAGTFGAFVGHGVFVLVSAEPRHVLATLLAQTLGALVGVLFVHTASARVV